MLRPNAGWSGQAANALLSLHPACALKATPSHAKRPYTRTEEADLTEMPADPGLNLEFVDEALSLVSDAEAKGIRLRILGSIAYRLQCPQNLHLFQDTKRVLTDVDFGAEKKQNRAIREFLVARGYVPDEGIYMASEGARHAYLHRQTSLNVDDIIGMMRQDWGFYYTFTTNLKRVPEHFSEFPSILEDQRGVISGRIAALLDAIEAAPKTIGWKMGSKTGTRSRWYQEV